MPNNRRLGKKIGIRLLASIFCSDLQGYKCWYENVLRLSSRYKEELQNTTQCSIPFSQTTWVGVCVCVCVCAHAQENGNIPQVFQSQLGHHG